MSEIMRESCFFVIQDLTGTIRRGCNCGTTASTGDNLYRNEAVLKLKSLEAFEKVADGQATTILMPADLQGIASVGTVLAEGMKSVK